MLTPDLVTNVPPSDLTGTILGVIGTLFAIASAIYTFARTRERPERESQEVVTATGSARIHDRIDAVDKALSAYKVEVAKEYASKQDLQTLETLLTDIDKRARKTETILRIVFRKQLSDAGYSSEE